VNQHNGENLYSGFNDPPPIIEMRIPFELIGLLGDSVKTIGIAFDVTETGVESLAGNDTTRHPSLVGYSTFF